MKIVYISVVNCINLLSIEKVDLVVLYTVVALDYIVLEIAVENVFDLKLNQKVIVLKVFHKIEIDNVKEVVTKILLDEGCRNLILVLENDSRIEIVFKVLFRI